MVFGHEPPSIRRLLRSKGMRRLRKAMESLPEPKQEGKAAGWTGSSPAGIFPPPLKRKKPDFAGNPPGPFRLIRIFVIMT